MKSVFIYLIASLICTVVLSQPTDFLVVKKDQRTIKNFFSGSHIGLETGGGKYYGLITAVKQDSLFLNQYDIRSVITGMGFYVVDTVATYRLSFNYKQILKIEKPKRKGFNWAASGGSLLGGGVLLTALGLGTWIFTKPGSSSHASVAFVAGSAALAGIGYLLVRSNGSYYSIGKKYQLEYVKVK